MTRLRSLLYMFSYGLFYGAAVGALSGIVVGFFVFGIGALFGFAIGVFEGAQIGALVGIGAGIVTNLFYSLNSWLKFYKLIMVVGCACMAGLLTFTKAHNYFASDTLIYVVSFLGAVCSIPGSLKLANLYLKSRTHFDLTPYP